MTATLRRAVRFEKESADSSLKFQGMIFYRAARDLDVIEGDGVICELLVIFVSFTCDQHNVACTGERNGAINRFSAIDNFLVTIRSKAFFGLGDNRGRIFLARIVRGDD